MRTQPILPGLIVGVSLLVLWPAAAEARPEYPGAIAEAANMACVPTCLLCHTTSPGTKNSWAGRPTGSALLTYGELVQGDPDTMQAAWDTLVGFATTEPAKVCWSGTDANKQPVTATCKAIVDAVPLGIEPLTKLSACGPTYGCGASVAQRPLADAQANRDPAPAVAAALAAIAGLFAMRRRRR